MTGDPPSSPPDQHHSDKISSKNSATDNQPLGIAPGSGLSGSQTSELATKARQGAFWMGATSALTQVLSWAMTIACARILQPSDYGIMALADTFLPYLAIVSTLSIGLWIVQESNLKESDLHAAASLAVILSGAVFLLTLLAGPSIARFYGDAGLALPFQLLGLIPFLKSLALTSDSWLRRELRYKELSFITAAVAFGRGVAQLFLAVLGFGFWSLILGLLLSELALCILTIRAGKKALPWKFNPQTWKRILAWGVPASLSAVCWIVYASADNIVVGRIFGKEILGYYAMGFYLASLPISKFNSMFRSVIFSYFARLKEMPEEFQRAVLRLNRNLCLIVFPSVVGLAAVSEDFVAVVFGDKWLPLIAPLHLLSLSAVFRAAVDNLGSFVSAAGDSALAFRIHAVGAAILPLSFFLAATFFGLEGIYGVWLLVFPVVMYLMLAISRKTLGVSPLTFLLDLRSPALAAGLMYFAVFAVRTLLPDLAPALRLCLLIPLGASAYVASLRLLFPEEWSGLKTLLLRSPSQA